MADALDREQEVAEVVIVEAAPRIVGREVLDHGRIDEQRERHLVTVLAHEELLARTARGGDAIADVTAHDELVDVDPGLDAVERLEATLDA